MTTMMISSKMDSAHLFTNVLIYRHSFFRLWPQYILNKNIIQQQNQDIYAIKALKFYAKILNVNKDFCLPAIDRSTL